jgi:poly(3-hydroxybutyrate) depolymerase
MKRILVCTGVLGGGTALVFALAAATAMLFPQGTLVASGWNNGMVFAKPMPMPVLERGGVFVDDVLEMPAVEVPMVVFPEEVP